MLKKLFCLLLASLMLTSTVACAQTDDTPTDTNETVATTEADTENKPDLPEMDYGGEEFRILTGKESYGTLVVEKTGGEVVNDAVLEANMAVSNQFNIRFANVTGNAETFILAGDDEYDVSYMHDCTTASMSLNGWFLNIYDLPYIDPTAEWWPQFIVDSLTLNGKMYYYSNYSTYSAMANTVGCFFNQRILENHNMTFPYEYIRKGTWTLDQITTMSVAIYSDVNGDGLQDTEDILGFACSKYPYAWLESFGIEFYQKESVDSAELTVRSDDERCYTLIDKLHTWLRTGYDSVWAPMNDAGGKEGMSMFAADHVAFTFANIGHLAPLAIDGDVRYGIVPLPKIDETQPQYYGGCTSELFSVPITLNDTERVGIILEAMAYAGHKYIRPAYCEQTLKTRFATDPDCSEMLNLIFDNQVISFAYLFANNVDGGNMQFCFIYDTVEQNTVASFLKIKSKREKKFVQKITEFYS